MTGVIDYMAGNATSIQAALTKIGARAIIVQRATELMNCDKIILPGVGSFDNAMQQLEKRGVLGVLHEKVLGEKVPFLGICLGMQLLAQDSEEGTNSGLGWIDCGVKKIQPIDNHIKVPHIGRNYVYKKEDSKLFYGISSGSEFYFAHSYYVDCRDEGYIAATTNYAISFASAIERGNIAGVQFHPEKSHKNGLQLLKNFIENF